jgi:hypothetical protein
VKNTILASPVNDLDTGCEIVWCSGSVISCDSDKTEKLFDKYVMEFDWLSTVLEYCTDPQGGHTHVAELPFNFSLNYYLVTEFLQESEFILLKQTVIINPSNVN